MLAPGYRADFIVVRQLSDNPKMLRRTVPEQVYVGGRRVFEAVVQDSDLSGLP